jgi:ABC-2 type transport system ATP-binding protein
VKDGGTAIVSSHNMLEVEYLCSRLALIHKGRIVAEGEPQRLVKMYEVSNLEELFMEVIGNAQAKAAR